jgi:hypothetical protein
MQFLEISWDFGILGFFQRFFGIFDEVYEDFQSNLPLDILYSQDVLSFRNLFSTLVFTFLNCRLIMFFGQNNTDTVHAE